MKSDEGEQLINKKLKNFNSNDIKRNIHISKRNTRRHHCSTQKPLKEITIQKFSTLENYVMENIYTDKAQMKYY